MGYWQKHRPHLGSTSDVTAWVTKILVAKRLGGVDLEKAEFADISVALASMVKHTTTKLNTHHQLHVAQAIAAD